MKNSKEIEHQQSLTKTNLIIYGSENEYCAWPSIARAGNGDILVSFCRTEQHIAPDGQIVMVRSKDNGMTWGKPEVIYDTVLDDRECGLTPLKDGRLMAHFQSYYWTRAEYEKSWFRWVTPDIQQRWLAYVDALDPVEARKQAGSRTAIIDTEGKRISKADQGPDSVHGGVQLSNGGLLTASYHDGKGGIRIFRSSAPGAHWNELAPIPSPQPDRVRFGEPHIIALPTGRIIMMIRLTNIPYDDASPCCVLWETYSDDQGQTWAKPFPTPLWGFPPHLALLSDGRVLATYGYRRPPYGQRACISRDGLRWDLKDEIILRDDAPNDDLGYPASLEVEPGKILTVYYQVNKPQVSKSLDYSRPAGEKPAILATRWTLPGGTERKMTSACLEKCRDTNCRMNSEKIMRIKLGRPSVVAVSPPAETRWGHYQFPGIARLDDGRLAVSYSVHSDSAMSYGQSPPARISSDGGKTWREAKPGELDASTAGGIIFPDGEALKFPVQKPLDASKLNLPKVSVSHTDLYGRKSDCYRLGDLPGDLQRVRLLRRKAGETQWREEWARIAIPEMVVRVFRWEWSDIGFSDPNILIQPRISTEFFWTFTPDGGLLTFAYAVCFNPDGSLPARGGVNAFCSDDRGRTWRLWGMPGNFPDAAAERAATQPFLDDPNSNYNKLWGGKDAAPVPNDDVGGLYEPGVVSFGNGRMICVMRTDSGGTHEPMFIARSMDWGKTWTSPEILTPFGVVPRMVHFDSGVVALVYGRPGVQLLFCTDGKGETWHTPMTLLPEPGERTRATVGRRGMVTTDRQVGHDDTCGNCTVLKTGPDRFLVAYSDFRYVDAAGQTCKAIKAQEVTVIPARGIQP